MTDTHIISNNARKISCVANVKGKWSFILLYHLVKITNQTNKQRAVFSFILYDSFFTLYLNQINVSRLKQVTYCPEDWFANQRRIRYLGLGCHPVVRRLRRSCSDAARQKRCWSRQWTTSLDQWLLPRRQHDRSLSNTFGRRGHENQFRKQTCKCPREDK